MCFSYLLNIVLCSVGQPVKRWSAVNAVCVEAIGGPVGGPVTQNAYSNRSLKPISKNE